MGLAFGLAAIAWLVVLVGEDPVAETWVVLLTSYACFLVSDELLGVRWVRGAGRVPAWAPAWALACWVSASWCV